MYRRIRDIAEEAREDAVRITQQLVQIPSFWLHEGKLADRVQNLFEEMNYDLVFRDAAGNVIGIMVGGEDGPAVLLNSHMDTVRPATDWDESPFSGEIREGRLYGVGAADCKSGIVTQILAGRVLNESRLPLRGTLVVAMTVAEENGCSAGTRHLLDVTLPKLGIEPGLAILGEPTSLAVCNGHDGWVDIDINLEGARKGDVRHATGLIVKYLRDAGPAHKNKNGIEVIRIEQHSPCDEYESTEAIIRVRHRVKIGETAEECLAWVQRKVISAIKILDRMPFSVHVRRERQTMYTGFSMDVAFQTNPWTTHPLVPTVDKAHTALAAAGLGDVPVRKWSLNHLGMGTSGSKLVDDFKIPTVGFGPGDESSAHAGGEHVDTDKLVDAVYGTAVLTHSVIGVPLYGWVAD